MGRVPGLFHSDSGGGWGGDSRASPRTTHTTVVVQGWATPVTIRGTTRVTVVYGDTRTGDGEGGIVGQVPGISRDYPCYCSVWGYSDGGRAGGV